MKSIILLSGGADSSTCLALAKDKREEVIAISFQYGQKHQRELKAAIDIADYYKVEHLILDISDIFKDSNSSLNKNNYIDVSLGDYEKQKDINTEVEFRNGIFLAIMASIALQKGADKIYYGAHQDDNGAIYADCSKEFIKSITETIKIGTRGKIKVETPFKNKTKKEIIKLGLSLKVPYELTYSCYQGGEKPCGKCGTCIDRRKAFNYNEIYDERYY